MTERKAAICWAWASIVLMVLAWLLAILLRDPRYLFGLGFLGFLVLAVTRWSTELPAGLRTGSLTVYVVSGAACLCLLCGRSGCY